MKKYCLVAVLMIFCLCGSLFASSLIIKKGDELGVMVEKEPDLTVKRLVDSNGQVDLPLIGLVKVDSLSPNAAAQLIADKYKDGYLRFPVVEVTLITVQTSPETSNRGSDTQSTTSLYSSLSQSTLAQPLYSDNLNSNPAYYPTAQSVRPRDEEHVLVELRDSETGRGIGGAALMIGQNRIYQSNRIGQVLIAEKSGKTIIIADGYKITNGDLYDLVRPGTPPIIMIDPQKINEAVTFTVVDSATNSPIGGVEITMGEATIKTNSRGTFIIKEIEKEYGELFLRHRHYKSRRHVVDFKGDVAQVLTMSRNE